MVTDKRETTLCFSLLWTNLEPAKNALYYTYTHCLFRIANSFSEVNLKDFPGIYQRRSGVFQRVFRILGDFEPPENPHSGSNFQFQ